MSGIAALIGRGGAPVDRRQVDAMLRRMPGRGIDRCEAWAHGSSALGVARYDWELGSGFSGGVMLAEDGGVVVAADATLYYRDELRTAIERQGVRPRSTAPGHLILAAYQAWGEGMLEHLEGDFALVVWDAEKRQLLCARDLLGTRPLYYAEVDGVVVVASEVGAVLGHPGCPHEVNLAAVADLAAGVFASDTDTCYEAISSVPAAHCVVFREGETRQRRFWSPPPVTPFRKADFEEGARELRRLIGRAVMERMDSAGTTGVWLSGGWDSTAVFGAGMDELRRAGDSRRLQPVSISYPPGDPGREDELIEMVLAHWGARTRWIDIRDVPPLDPHFAERAATSDDAFFHPYETWNRALAETSASAGDRVALTGMGGDSLFQVSPMYLSDLFVRGRWLAFAREWREKGYRGWKRFLRWVVRPAIPPWLAAPVAAVRGGREWLHPLEHTVPPWVDPGRVRLAAARTKDREFLRAIGARGSVAGELVLCYVRSYFPRMAVEVGRIALETGVEVRHPLFDQRIIRFALSRPWWELASGRDTKRLLRRSMHGLLPDAVLCSRPYRTGLSHAALERETPMTLRRMLGDGFRMPQVDRLGVLEVAGLEQAVDRAIRVGTMPHLFSSLWTLRTALWLDARRGSARSVGDPSPGSQAPAATHGT